MARRGEWVELRDDKVDFGAAADHRLTFTAAEFDAYQAAVRSGVDLGGLCLSVTRRDGFYVFRSAVAQPSGERAELVFDADEVAAFYAGVCDGEFDATAFAVA